jgi:hypothetical protein
MKTGPVVGIAWFRPDQWQRLLATAADADTLERTHEQWERQAKKTLKRLRREGLNVRRADVDIEDLIFWCNQQHCDLDGKARADYAALKLREQEQTRHD